MDRPSLKTRDIIAEFVPCFLSPVKSAALLRFLAPGRQLVVPICRLCSSCLVTVMYTITIMCICSFQVLIASIMCSYSKEDWTELSKMAEVMVS